MRAGELSRSCLRAAGCGRATGWPPGGPGAGRGPPYPVAAPRPGGEATGSGPGVRAEWGLGAGPAWARRVAQTLGPREPLLRAPPPPLQELLAVGIPPAAGIPTGAIVGKLLVPCLLRALFPKLPLGYSSGLQFAKRLSCTLSSPGVCYPDDQETWALEAFVAKLLSLINAKASRPLGDLGEEFVPSWASAQS